MKPTLLLYIPTWNRLPRLQRCLTRALAEVEGVESRVLVHVSDNASDDGTGEWLASLTHPSLRVTRHARNLGGPRNIVAVHALAEMAEYTWIIGDDDALAGGAIRRLLAAIDAYPTADVLFLNSIAYPGTEEARITTALEATDWTELAEGGTRKSRLDRDQPCLYRELINPAVDEVLGGSLMCWAWRSALVQDQIGPVLDEERFGSMLTSYPHTLNLLYSLRPESPALHLRDPFTVTFWHEGTEWGRDAYHRIVTQGLGHVLFEQQRLGYIPAQLFPTWVAHWWNIARPSLLHLLRPSRETGPVLDPRFSERLLWQLLAA